jgi:hypothetical protein
MILQPTPVVRTFQITSLTLADRIPINIQDPGYLNPTITFVEQQDDVDPAGLSFIFLFLIHERETI